jgi:hypothetical protein
MGTRGADEVEGLAGVAIACVVAADGLNLVILDTVGSLRAACSLIDSLFVLALLFCGFGGGVARFLASRRTSSKSGDSPSSCSDESIMV